MCILKNCNKQVYSDTLSSSRVRVSGYGVLNRTTMGELLVRKLYGYMRMLAQRFINILQLRHGLCGCCCVFKFFKCFS